MSRHDRSRSPKDKNSEWISRQIANFGRRREKRPQGLYVQDDGTIELENLMSTWGKQQGFSKEDVVKAVQTHMFTSQAASNGTPTLRFTLGQTDGGDMSIRVHPGRSNGVATPARSNWSEGSEQGDGNRQAWNKDDKWWEREGNASSDWKKDDWKKDDWWKKDRGKEDSWKKGGGASSKPRGEQVQRWLAYILKRGHEDLGITVDSDGWARLSDLSWAAKKSRQNFEIGTEEDLKELIEETDREGRFEIDASGRIRKLPRGQRTQRHVPAPATASGRRQQNDRRVSTPPRQGGGGNNRRKPPMPPPGGTGKGWQKYQDDGVVWYYYEGPLGKWWCQEGDRGPDPRSLAEFDEEDGE